MRNFNRGKKLFFANLIFSFFLFSSAIGEKLISSENRSLKIDQKNNEVILNKNYFKRIPTIDYIFGPGDVLSIIPSREYPELYTETIIDGEGTIYLPRLKRIYISGLSIKELNNLLNSAYEEFINFPDAEINILDYRDVKINIIGEVNNPGIKKIPGSLGIKNDRIYKYSSELTKAESTELEIGIKNLNKSDIRNKKTDTNISYYFPTVYDAIRIAGGITHYSDLSNVEIIRKNNKSNGGGLIKTTLNFSGQNSDDIFTQNIRIYDSDTIRISKLDNSLNDREFFNAGKNLNPEFLSVFVKGKVLAPGRINIKQNSSLNEAIYMAGGPKGISGPIKFIRFKNDGTIDKRIIKLNLRSKSGSKNNPYLQQSDLIVVGKTKYNAASELIKEVTAPFTGIYSTYALFEAIFD